MFGDCVPVELCRGAAASAVFIKVFLRNECFRAAGCHPYGQGTYLR